VAPCLAELQCDAGNNLDCIELFTGHEYVRDFVCVDNDRGNMFDPNDDAAGDFLCSALDFPQLSRLTWVLGGSGAAGGGAGADDVDRNEPHRLLRAICLLSRCSMLTSLSISTPRFRLPAQQLVACIGAAVGDTLMDLTLLDCAFPTDTADASRALCSLPTLCKLRALTVHLPWPFFHGGAGSAHDRVPSLEEVVRALVRPLPWLRKAVPLKTITLCCTRHRRERLVQPFSTVWCGELCAANRGLSIVLT
jgi:hypothetical protein